MMQSTEARVPPQVVDVEMAELGAVLFDNAALPKILEVHDETALYSPKHQYILAAMISLFEQSTKIDIHTLTHELRRRGKLENVGGEEYLNILRTKITSDANVAYHAHIVLEKHIARQLIAVHSEVICRAFSETEDADELISYAESEILSLKQNKEKRSSVTLSSAIHKVLESLEGGRNKSSGITGVPTAFTEFDSITGGLQKSDLIIVAGRPSQGKTAFVLSLSVNTTILHDTVVGFFSLEMSVQQLMVRLIASRANVDAHKLRNGRLPEDDWKKVSMAAGKLYKGKLFVDDTPGLSVTELCAKARRLKAEQHAGLIIVDYLQLMQGPPKKSREQEVAYISRSLKALAKELDIPVVALSQLNRAVEMRGSKRPVLADLRESGGIEQDADVVVFIHRPEMHGIAKDEDGNLTEGIAEIIVGKQRNGPTGIVKMSFVKRCARFDNFVRFREAPKELQAREFPAEEMPF